MEKRLCSTFRQVIFHEWFELTVLLAYLFMQVSGEQYLTEVRGLNVQVDNLCQFLPQDRVQDFAKQNPQELFCSTQYAVCKEKLVEQFDELKELRELQMSSSTRQQKQAALLHELQQRLSVLSDEVRVIEERETLNIRCDVIRKKIAWMDFEKSYIKCDEIDKDFQLAKDKFDKDNKAHNELVKSAEGITAKRKHYETQHQSECQKRKKCDDELDRIIGKMDALKDDIKKAKNDLAFAKRTVADHQKEVDECRLIESGYRHDYDQMLAQSENYAAKLQAIDAELRQKTQGIDKLNGVRTTLNNDIEAQKHYVQSIDNKLKAAESEKERRMEILQQRFPDTYKATLWLRENLQLFSGQVFEPIMMELAVNQIEHAKYIEAAIGLRDLTAFTCTNVEDMNLLMKKLRVEQRLKCNVVHSDAATSIQYHPNAQIAALRHLGARSFLIDSIEGPPPIINYLCQIYKIQNTIIGVDELERNSEQLPQWVQLFFTNNDRISIHKSKYSSERMLQSTPIVRNNVFNDRIPPQELEKLKQQRVDSVRKLDKCRNKRSEIEKTIESNEVECRRIIKKQNELTGAKSKLQEAKTKLTMQSEKLRRIIAAAVDVEAENEKWLVVSRQTIKQLVKFQANAVQVYENLTTVGSCEETAKFRLDKFKSSFASIDVQIMASEEQVDRSKSYVDRIGRLLNEAKEECKKKQMDAMKLTNNRKPSDGARFPYKKQFDELSNNIDELKDEIGEIEAQLECQSAPQRETVREYEDRKRQLEQLEKEIADSERSAANTQRDMVNLHLRWFPAIQSIVDSINENFSRFMATMSCAGEIELIRESEHEYTTYGIEIRVKYRNNERLKPLDRFVQSGGERAVAIAVYSLSLQHLSQVPFRCVDEINQGMDSYNERRVFDMLVKIVAREHQSQFFYVTPKLLSNLSCNEYVTCCVVYNGPHATHNNYFIENGMQHSKLLLHTFINEFVGRNLNAFFFSFLLFRGRFLNGWIRIQDTRCGYARRRMS